MVPGHSDVRDWMESHVGQSLLPNTGTNVNYLNAPSGAMAYTSHSLGL
jgi:hypothetical protein